MPNFMALMLIEGYCCGLMFQANYHDETRPPESVVEQGFQHRYECNDRSAARRV